MVINHAKFDACSCSNFRGVKTGTQTIRETELLFIQGGPKVGIQLLNYFLYALKLPAVHFMWPKSRYTVNGENYLEILREVVVPQLRAKPNFDELFFQ